MTWGIIGALDQEVALIKEKMTMEQTVQRFGCDYYVGTIADQKVVLVCCSVGTINAAACACTLVGEFRVDAVVNVGIAGSLCRELSILDVVLATDVVFHDCDLDIIEKYYPFRRSFAADEALRQLAQKAIESLPGRNFRYKSGRIATGDRFVNSRALRDQIEEQFAPLCVEMEGAAIGQIAHMSGVPFLVIRTLSDNADDEADNTYDDFLDRAAHQSAAILLNMIAASV